MAVHGRGECAMRLQKELGALGSCLGASLNGRWFASLTPVFEVNSDEGGSKDNSGKTYFLAERFLFSEKILKR